LVLLITEWEYLFIALKSATNYTFLQSQLTFMVEGERFGIVFANLDAIQRYRLYRVAVNSNRYRSEE
jgi:hypothetical protein